jgi:lambda repressor-like predicted transcriptional regulator
MLGSDPSLAWETVNNALLYVWKKLDQFATWTPGAKERFPSARQCEAAAKKVEAHLASTGMGQLKFGKQAGTSERTIRKILTREAVSRATYEGVADAMGLSFDNLLDS